MPALFRKIACLFVVLGLTSCAAAGRPATPARNLELQWPPLPLEPQIVWSREVRNHEEAGLSQGFWKKLTGFIAGEKPAGITKPYGIYADKTGRVFVADVGAAMIHVFDFGSGKYSTIDGAAVNGFRIPIGIAGDDDGNIFITDSGLGAIFRYSVKSDKIVRFTPYKLGRPTGVGYSRQSRLLYVSDTASHQVVAFDLQGVERFRFGGRGDGEGSFNYPTDLCVDSHGRVLVTDALNARIQIFSPEGDFIMSLGTHGDKLGYFSKPKGVAVDSEDHIYVADALFDTVQIFDADGNLLLNFGASGSQPGEFWMPSGMHIDPHNNIYVADTYNQRMQVFKYQK